MPPPPIGKAANMPSRKPRPCAKDSLIARRSLDCVSRVSIIFAKVASLRAACASYFAAIAAICVSRMASRSCSLCVISKAPENKTANPQGGKTKASAACEDQKDREIFVHLTLLRVVRDIEAERSYAGRRPYRRGVRIIPVLIRLIHPIKGFAAVKITVF